MEPIRYVRAIRRRWAVILAFVLLAGAVGWLTASSVAPANARPQVYSASALVDTQGDLSSQTPSTAISPDLLVVYVTLRTNGQAVAKKIDYQGSVTSLLSRIHASADSNTGIITIQAVDPAPRTAEQLANAFAAQLITFVQDRQDTGLRQQIDALTQELRAARRGGGSSASSGSSSSKGSGTGTEQNASVFQLQQQLDGLRQQLHTSVPISTLQGAVATPLAASGLQAPSTRAGRVALAALAGLLAGIVLALVLERFDTRIRTRDTAEQRFGVPVLAEVPRLPRSERRAITSATRPTSPAADAFRLIAAAVTRATQRDGDASTEGARRRGAVVLVTSSGPSEGKTTVAANLATVFAEVGRSVMILSCDLRRPQIHRLFDVDDAPGLTDALASQNGHPLLDGREKPTQVANVTVVPAGTVNGVPAGLLGSDRMRKVLAEARARADVVVMDTAPILVASEVAPLIGDVDAVVVVAEAGKTTSEVAGRTIDLLNRLGAPVVGVVLNRAGEITIPRGYYRYYSMPRPPTPTADAADDRVAAGGSPIDEAPARPGPEGRDR